MAKNSPVLVLGEALVDVVHKDGNISEHVGGSPANVAFGLGRLDHDVTLAAWFALDDRGKRILAACEDANVKVMPLKFMKKSGNRAHALLSIVDAGNKHGFGHQRTGKRGPESACAIEQDIKPQIVMRPVDPSPWPFVHGIDLERNPVSRTQFTTHLFLPEQ